MNTPPNQDPHRQQSNRNIIQDVDSFLSRRINRSGGSDRSGSLSRAGSGRSDALSRARSANQGIPTIPLSPARSSLPDFFGNDWQAGNGLDGELDPDSPVAQPPQPIVVQQYIIDLFEKIYEEVQDPGWKVGVDEDNNFVLGWIAGDLYISAHNNEEPNSYAGVRLGQIIDSMYGEQDGVWRDVLNGRVEFNRSQIPEIVRQISQPPPPQISQQDIDTNAERMRSQMAQSMYDDTASKLEDIDELCGLCSEKPINLDMQHSGANGDILHHYLCADCFELLGGDGSECPLDKEIVRAGIKTDLAIKKLDFYEMLLQASREDLQAILESISSGETESRLGQLIADLKKEIQEAIDNGVMSGVGETRQPTDEILFLIQKARQRRQSQPRSSFNSQHKKTNNLRKRDFINAVQTKKYQKHKAISFITVISFLVN